MKSYPVSVPRNYYRGTNQRRQQKTNDYNRVADRVESYINGDLARQPEDTINRYMSNMVALDLGESHDLVSEVIFGIDCGHNGVTVVKGDFERAMRKLSTPPNAAAATA